MAISIWPSLAINILHIIYNLLYTTIYNIIYNKLLKFEFKLKNKIKKFKSLNKLTLLKILFYFCK